MSDDDDFNPFSTEGFGEILGDRDFDNIFNDEDNISEYEVNDNDDESVDIKEDNDIDLPADIYDKIKELNIELSDDDEEEFNVEKEDNDTNDNYEFNMYDEEYDIPKIDSDIIVDKKTVDIIDNVSRNIGIEKNTRLSKMKEDDYKTKLCVEIEQLYDELTDYDPLAKDPNVNQNMTVEELIQIRDMLSTRCNAHAAAMMTEELITFFGQNVIERIFNGKNKIFGKTPNLTGWTERDAIPRLKKTKYETAKFANSVYNNLGIGPNMKIFLGLIMSMFTYARNDMASNNVSDYEYKRAQAKLNDRTKQ